MPEEQNFNIYRPLAAIILAPALVAFIPVLPTPRPWDGALAVFIWGTISVLTIYVPLMWWRMLKTEHPFLTCVVLGALSAPGPIGYAMLAYEATFGVGVADAFVPIFSFTVPIGAIGGVVFWLLAFWRNGPLPVS